MDKLVFYNWTILGIRLYQILSWFFCYSFLGWIWESSYVSIKTKRWVNRGFVTGPCLTIYGAGAVSVYLLLKDLPKNIVILYVGGVVAATLLEYITSALMEFLFHMSWWDYSDKKFNFQGRICLESSLFWGIMTLMLFYVFQPFVEWFCNLIPKNIGIWILDGVIFIYMLDFISAFVEAMDLSKKMQRANHLLDEWSEFLHESRLYNSADEFKVKIKSARHELSNRAAKIQLELREKETLDIWDRLHADETNKMKLREEFKKKYQDYSNRLSEMKKRHNFITKRFLRAYPKLGNLSNKRGSKKEQM